MTSITTRLLFWAASQLTCICQPHSHLSVMLPFVSRVAHPLRFLQRVGIPERCELRCKGFCRPYGTQFQFGVTDPGLTSWAIVCRPYGAGVCRSVLPLRPGFALQKQKPRDSIGAFFTERRLSYITNGRSVMSFVKQLWGRA